MVEKFLQLQPTEHAIGHGRMIGVGTEPMFVRWRSFTPVFAVLSALLLTPTGCTKKHTLLIAPGELKLEVKAPFRFVAYGDARFHDPRDFDAANPPVRAALVRAIAEANMNVKAFGWRLPFQIFPSQLLWLLGVAMAAALCAAALPVVRLARMQPASLIRIFANER